MGALVWLVVVVSAIWVYVDARSIGVRKGLVTGLGDMGPVGWAVSTLFLWIVAFPLYLVKRRQFRIAVATAAPTVGDREPR